jgi:hypothetical protein
MPPIHLSSAAALGPTGIANCLSGQREQNAGLLAASALDGTRQVSAAPIEVAVDKLHGFAAGGVDTQEESNILRVVLPRNRAGFDT